LIKIPNLLTEISSSFYKRNQKKSLVFYPFPPADEFPISRITRTLFLAASKLSIINAGITIMDLLFRTWFSWMIRVGFLVVLLVLVYRDRDYNRDKIRHQSSMIIS
jgi:hypothetical protein